MSQKSSACDLERLQGLLTGQLAEAVEQEATQHVAECERCRRQLEDLAGDRAWWQEMESSLRSSSAELSSQSVSTSRVAAPAIPAIVADDSFIADFAVAFLEPCDRPGTLGRLEDIEILEVIGYGGMGIVLKGFQRELGRYVAVKVLSPHMAASGAARTRFAREARAAAAVVHPHVMAIHAVHSSGRLPLLVMPYLACESLQQRLDRCGSLELNEILRIGHQIADGLAAAHAQGLVHRDVKPANILLERGVDRVLLTDFGLARAADDASLTRTGIIAGTPQYMSPEQAHGDALDARSDLFSLGSVLYALSAGRPPFRAETSYGILRRITDSEPHALREINPAIPAWLEGIIRRLHSKEAAERYGSAAEVASLLSRCLAHIQQPLAVPLPADCVPFLSEGAAPMSSTPQRPFFKRWPGQLAIATLILVPVFLVAGKLLFELKPEFSQSRSVASGNYYHYRPVSDGAAETPPARNTTTTEASIPDGLDANEEPPPAATPVPRPRRVEVKPSTPVEVPTWDAAEQELNQLSFTLRTLEQQNWSPTEYPVVHPAANDESPY